MPSRGGHTLLTTLLAACASGEPPATWSLAPASPGDLAQAGQTNLSTAGADQQLQPVAPGLFRARVSRGLYAELSENGLVAWTGYDELSLRFSSWGRQGALQAVDGVEPTVGDCAPAAEPTEGACPRQVELHHGEVTEWWVGRSAGLQQGWVLWSAPDGQGVVELRVEVLAGAVRSVEADQALLTGTAGRTWIYGGLTAWDANGTDVPVALVDRGDALGLVLNVEGAAWPIVVDPVLSSTEDKLTASDGAAYDSFGWSVAGAGDVNGDGYADLVVGSLADDDAGSASGSAYVYYGSAAGIDASPEDKLIPLDGYAGNVFGGSVAGAGDVNGDGYADVVVGSYNDGDAGLLNSGSAYLYNGTATGIDVRTEDKLTASDAAAHGYFGITVAGAGDVNGDGYADLVVGAPGDDTARGAAYVYYGSASGIDAFTEDKLTASDGRGYDYFGVSVAGAGDVNGDGYADLVVGAYMDDHSATDSGSAYVYYGSATGIDASAEDKLAASDASSYDSFGWSVAGAGDVTGDGYADLVVGAYLSDDGGAESGSAYVYYGSASGVDASAEDKLAASDAAAGARFGYSVAGAGDVNADGYADLVVGAYRSDDGGTERGSAYVYYGTASSIDASAEDKLIASDGVAYDSFGRSVAGAGDVNSDGYADLVVGAYKDDDRGSDSGSVYVYFDPCIDADADGFCLSDDCDDTDASFNPGATEVWYDGVDHNCDGNDDDQDGDGYPVADDCDDTDASFSPGATEVWYDGVDHNCDGNDDDQDGDGYPLAEDCDDTDASAEPGGTEVWYDGVDQDCDGNDDDQDHDGYPLAEDCDDMNASVQPGATEVWYDGVDQDCDGNDDDQDRDGYPLAEDCDDTDASSNPSATEVWYDSVDQDCDGNDDDQDGDSYPLAEDCDDTDASVNPGAAEVLGDGVDQDCDGEDASAEDTGDSKGWGCAATPASAIGRTPAWVLGLVAAAAVRRRRGKGSQPSSSPGADGSSGQPPPSPV
jgi:hypothetical protein